MKAAAADYRVAHAAGTDAGNRSMRAAGRTAWDASDFDDAAATFARLYGAQAPQEAAKAAQGPRKPAQGTATAKPWPPRRLAR